MRCPALRVLLVAFLAVALVSGIGVPASGNSPIDTTDSSGLEASTSSVDGEGASPYRPQVTAFDQPPVTDIRIDLRPDRDAHWEVVVRYEFTDANETDVFENVSDRFLDGELGPSETPYENFAEGASRNVDREMRIENVERSVEIHDDPGEFEVDDDVVAVGELRLTFVWTDFIETDGENLVLGDALTTPTNETWLRSLEDGQSIEVLTPSGYSVSGTPGATVPLRENAVIIDGPRVFEEERVVIVYSPTPTPDTPPWTMLAGAIVLAALLIALGLLGYRRIGSDDEPGTNGTVAPAPGSSTDSISDVDGETGSRPGAGIGRETEEDLSLLSDEERVERLLERNEGRMRQADIVSETGWSDAKVSQLLSAMADEGRVEKLRLGRENLISLPDDEDGGDESTGETSGNEI